MNPKELYIEFRKVLPEAVEFMTAELVQGLKDQGHKATGKLLKSIEGRIYDNLNEIGLEFQNLKYGVYVDKGVSASRIPFSGSRTPGAGSKRQSRYIQALIRWVRVKKLTTGLKDARSMAFAIANKHKREGMPTAASRRFSKTGRRTGYIADTVKRTDRAFTTIMKDVTHEAVEAFIFKKLDKYAA